MDIIFEWNILSGQNQDQMIEALFSKQLDEKQVQCTLCPKNCVVEIQKFGDCFARRNRNGVLISEVYGRISAMELDPIEKKPMYHFYPGKKILSIGTTGCNFHCTFCQNHTLSQCHYHKPVVVKMLTPEELVDLACKEEDNVGVAFTYNEPIVNYEFVIETARLLKMRNKVSLMVSNGYINPDPLEFLLEYVDGFNIDLKAFNEHFYKKYTKATLDPVKRTIQRIAKSGKHMEITNLVIPTRNDDTEEFTSMCEWIRDVAGSDTVLHLSRYFPRHEMSDYPTPPELLFELYDIAKEYLNHVYIGNMATELHSNTFCPKCNNNLVERTYFNIVNKGLDSNGACKKCGELVIPIF